MKSDHPLDVRLSTDVTVRDLFGTVTGNSCYLIICKYHLNRKFFKSYISVIFMVTNYGFVLKKHQPKIKIKNKKIKSTSLLIMLL